MTTRTDTVGAFVGEPAVLAHGAPDGPLAGRRLAVKDLFDVAGTVTGAGNPTFAASRPPATRTASAVERLVAAGATVVGKTITDELAYSLSGTNVHHGTPRNVNAPGRVPGGSSAGSAAAVAAGVADLALGTDTGGSVRVPASYCGIAGWRPSHGAVAIDGVVPLAPSFDTVGVLAAGPALLRLAAEALLAPVVDDGDDLDDPPLRLVMLGEALAEVDDAIAAACVDAVRSLGEEPPTVAIGVELGAAVQAFRDRQGWEAWQVHGGWLTSAAPAMGRGIAARFEAASRVTARDVEAADVVRAQVRDALVRATAGGTVLVQPAAAGAAPAAHGDGPRAAHERRRLQTLRLTCLAGLAGAPVVVLPLARDPLDGGLPLGVAFVGAPGSDRRLLRVAASYEVPAP